MATVRFAALVALAACSSPTSGESRPPVGADAGVHPDDTSDAPVVTPSEPIGPLPRPDDQNYTCGEINAVPYEGRLLTRVQYQNSVTDLFGGRIKDQWVGNFPSENEVGGFRTNAESHRATPWLADAHLKAAESIAAQVRAHLDELAACAAAPDLAEPSADPTLNERAQSCARDFLSTYGFRAYRRPLTAAEEQPMLALFERAYQAAGAPYGVELMTQTLLLAPQFLYRFEAPKEALEPQADAQLVDSFGLASRLSYLLWNSMPDDELFALAQTGALEQPEILRKQTERLLDSPKSQATIADFAEQWLGLSSLNGAVRRMPTRTPESEDPTDESTTSDTAEEARDSNHLSPAWQDSVVAFVKHVYASAATFHDLMTSSTVFVDADLAQLYGVALPEAAVDGELVGVEFAPSERAGLLTQPGLMAMLAHSDQSAPILRGVFVLDALLCQPPPPAPATVDTTPPMLDTKATTRERFAQHTSQSACAACHKFIDPIGLGLENYDELGRYRETENGLMVDTSGELVALRDSASNGTFEGAVGLAERLADSAQAERCFVSKWYQYGTGRPEKARDLCTINDLSAAFAQSGGDLRELLVAFVMSDAFRYRTVEAVHSTRAPEGEQ